MKYIYNEYLAIIEWGGIGREEFCRLGRMLSAEVDNIVQDLPKAELNNCFISHSKYFWFVINKLTFSKTFFKTLAYFSAWFRDITYVFPWRYSSKLDNTPPAIRLTYSCISFVQLVNYSAISPSDSRERHFLLWLTQEQRARLPRLERSLSTTGHDCCAPTPPQPAKSWKSKQSNPVQLIRTLRGP